MIRDPAEVGAQARLVVERFYVLTRNLAVHGDGHPLVAQNAAALSAAMDAAGPPYALQFVGHAVFIDRVLAVLDALNFSRSLKLARYLAAVGVNEVRVEYAPSPHDLIALARALLSRGSSAPAVDGLHLREIRGVSGGGSGEVIDPELFSTAQMVRALIETEGLEAAIADGWAWSSGISVVRRVERARSVDLASCLRFIDFAPGALTVPRRALGALLNVLSMTLATGLSTSLSRVASHTAFALGLYGLAEREGASFVEAVETSLPRMVATAMSGSAHLDPHRQRVCALLQSVVARHEAPAQWNPLARAVALAYDLERLRCPLGPDYDLRGIDLLAWAARQGERAHLRPWVRALFAVYGVLPPNARVLMEGRPAIVLGGAEDGAPFTPLVYLRDEGTLALPDDPVTLARSADAVGDRARDGDPGRISAPG